MSEPIENYRAPGNPPGPYPPGPAYPRAQPSAPPDMGYGQQPYSAPPAPARQWADQQYHADQQYPAATVSSQVPAIYQSNAVAQQPYAAPMPQRPVAAQYTLVTPGARLGASLLDLLLALVTFGIGWWIWSFFTWSNGQSPAKSLLGHVVADPQTGQAFDWGRMCMRELLIRGLLFGLLGAVTGGIFAIVDGCMVFGAGHRTLHDRTAGSIVRLA